MPNVSRITRVLRICALTTLAHPANAQQPSSFFYPVPSRDSYSITRDVQFGLTDSVRLLMDVYRPTPHSAKRPALIFFHTKFAASQPRSPVIVAWSQIAAANGLVGIFPDLRAGSAAADLQQLLGHLTQNADRYGLDAEAIAIWAASGNAATALPILQDPQQTAVKAAVIYYGGGSDIKEFRRDLPMLLIRAGLDRPPVNARFDDMAKALLTQNAPVTIINNSAGYHAFENRNDDAATRLMVDATIDFVKRATSASYQLAIRGGLTESTAAARIAMQDFRTAAQLYADLVQARPNDASLRLAYGEALLGAGQYSAACAEFEQLKGKGLGPRDLGLPAARACILKGDPEAALAWLRTIPRQFLPPSVESDAAFVSLRDRPEFAALFRP